MGDEGQWFLLIVATGLAILLSLQGVETLAPQKAFSATGDAGAAADLQPYEVVQQIGICSGYKTP